MSLPLENLTPAPEDQKTSFDLLVGAEAFVRAFEAALPTCQRQLYVQFSTFEGDNSGQHFAALLLDKAKQGVDVRLTVDCYSDVVLNDVYPILIHRRHQVQQERATTLALFDHLRQNNVPVRRTAPPGFLNKYILYRDHKKMVVLDDHTAFVGGINVSDHNYAWHDFMVKISGPLVKDLQRDYLSSWEGKTVPFNQADPQGDSVVNQSAGRYAIFDEIIRSIENARSSIVIQSPYLMGDHFEPALKRAAERGVRITLILPFHSNKLLYRIWVKKLRRGLDHPNITIYGYKGEHLMTHAKLMIVDGQRATFGSYNMFELEGLTQKELNIFTSNPDFIAQLETFIQQDIAHSEVLPVPSSSPGYFSYRLLYRFFKWWTQRLLRNSEWRSIYC